MNLRKKTAMDKTPILWEELRPALEKAWEGWDLLHGFDAGWEAQERALFEKNPRLYRDYKTGHTPAMQHGAARSALLDYLGAYFQKWGKAVTLRDLEDYLQTSKKR